MKLTEKQIELFKVLSESGIGKELSEYCDDLIDHACNSRYWGPSETKETSQHVARIIQSYLIDKIRLQNKPKDIEVNQFT